MNRPVFTLIALLSTPFLSGEELTLREALTRALTRGHTWAAARARDSEARAEAELAADEFHPEVLLLTTPGYASGPSLAVHLPVIASVQVRELLFDPMRRSDLLTAQVKEAHTSGQIEATRTRIAATVVRAYARLWLDDSLLRNALARERSQERLLGQTEALFDEGRSTRLDVERARLSLARARQARLDSESERELDSLELAHLMGEGTLLASPSEDLVSTLSEPPEEGSVDLARSRDPELRAFGPELQAAEEAQRQSAKTFTPTIWAAAQYQRLYHTSTYDQFYANFKPDDWSIGASVTVPLFSGGRKRDARLRANASYSQILEERRERDFQVEMAVSRARDARGRARARTSIARRAEGCAEEALDIAQARSREGRAEPGEVEQAEIARADARDETARASADLLAARADLLALRGELFSGLGLGGN